MPFMAMQANTSYVNNLLSLTNSYLYKQTQYLYGTVDFGTPKSVSYATKKKSSKPDAIMQVQCGPQTYCSQFLSSY